MFDGCLGVALGGCGPQFDGNGGVWNQIAGAGVSFDGFRITASRVGFIAFPEEFLRFVNGGTAAGNFVGGKV